MACQSCLYLLTQLGTVRALKDQCTFEIEMKIEKKAFGCASEEMQKVGPLALSQKETKRRQNSASGRAGGQGWWQG